jgi:methionyl aminopeptidase
MVNEGGPNVKTLPDRWTVVTTDRRRSAHFEHTVGVTEAGPRILTEPLATVGGSRDGGGSRGRVEG